MASHLSRFQPRRSLSPSRSQARLVGLAASAAMFSLASFTGCAKPLLSPTESRSPFDRYDAVRQQYASQFVEDKYGRRQPNLRARLAPKE